MSYPVAMMAEAHPDIISEHGGRYNDIVNADQVPGVENTYKRKVTHEIVKEMKENPDKYKFHVFVRGTEYGEEKDNDLPHYGKTASEPGFVMVDIGKYKNTNHHYGYSGEQHNFLLVSDLRNTEGRYPLANFKNMPSSVPVGQIDEVYFQWAEAPSPIGSTIVRPPKPVITSRNDKTYHSILNAGEVSGVNDNYKLKVTDEIINEMKENPDKYQFHVFVFASILGSERYGGKPQNTDKDLPHYDNGKYVMVDIGKYESDEKDYFSGSTVYKFLLKFSDYGQSGGPLKIRKSQVTDIDMNKVYYKNIEKSFIGTLPHGENYNNAVRTMMAPMAPRVPGTVGGRLRRKSKSRKNKRNSKTRKNKTPKRRHR